MPDTSDPSATAGDSLGTYRAKRSPDRTPEPMGAVSAVPGNLFVVHKHAARNLHFAFSDRGRFQKVRRTTWQTSVLR